MKNYHASELMVHCVTRLVAISKGREIGTGTGYFMQLAEHEGRQVVAIVTNKHVIEGADSVRFVITHMPNEYAGELIAPKEVVEYEMVEIPLSNDSLKLHPSPEIDLCCIYYSSFLDFLRARNRVSQHTVLPASVSVPQEVVDSILPLDTVAMIGYPTGLWDEANNGAIARRGSLATAPNCDFQGKPEFVVDMACFPGSSGSPVFLYNEYIHYDRRSSTLVNHPRCWLLGTLYAGPMMNARGEVVVEPIPMGYSTHTNVMINLGYVIKASELEPFIRSAEYALYTEVI
jgi:hypothetical protein